MISIFFHYKNSNRFLANKRIDFISHKVVGLAHKMVVMAIIPSFHHFLP